MSSIALTDVVPALDALGSERLEDIVGRYAPKTLADLPGEWLVTDHVVADKIHPPLSLALALAVMAEPSLRTTPLASLAPDFVRGDKISGSVIAAEQLNSLESHGITRWSQVGPWTPARLREVFSELTATMIVSASLREASMQALDLAKTGSPPPATLLAGLETIALWAERELHASTLGDAIKATCSEPHLPSEVQRASARLSHLSLALVAAGDPTPYDLRGALRTLLACDERSRLILIERIFPGEKKLTLDQLGSRLSVTRERVRQIETQLRKNMEAVLDSGRIDVVKRAAQRLRNELGTCSGLGDLPDLAAWAVSLREAPDDEQALHARVLLSVAGPYAIHDEWLIREPASDMIAHTSRKLDERLAEALLPLPDARNILADAGVPTSDHRAWLERVCKCRVIDETVLPWRGSMADKTVAILQLRGEPLTGDEIANALGPATNYRSMINQIQADSRFLRRGLKLYGLRSWGGEEYTTVAEEIEQEIERRGGAAPLEYLITTLCEQFGVSESSVRAYAASAPFIRTAEGLITIGTGHAPYSRRAIEDCRGCFRIGAHWALRLLVDGEVLRGSGRQIPVGIPQLLGIQPGESRHLTTPVGDLLVRYSRQATIGSLRKGALATGCHEGDRLFVIFISDTSVDFAAVRASELDGLAGPERLAAELHGDVESDPIPAIAHALGLPSDEYRASAIRRRLVARKEDDLISLVASVEDDDSDDDVLGQLIGLGE